MSKKISFTLIVLLWSISISIIAAPNIDQQIISVGLDPQNLPSTIRIQSLSGEWKCSFYVASTPVTTATATSIIPEGEDITLTSVRDKLIIRYSSGREIEGNFKRMVISGGNLLNFEIPDHKPLMFQGEIIAEALDDKIKLINNLSVHQLIVSSISQIGVSNEPEALKAMIIMARTRLKFLLKNSSHKKHNFSICGTSHCFPFAGCNHDRDLVDLLVTMTKDKVLTYKNKPFFPRFSLSCGGKISSAKDVYGLDEPYHPSIVDILDDKGSENCFHAPGFHWACELKNSQILDFLSISFAGGAEDVFFKWKPVKVDGNGRICEVAILGKITKNITGLEFFDSLINHFGRNSIRSMRVNVESVGDFVIFRGTGQGPGVGMCLYGTDGLAKKEQGYESILSFYYPRTKLK